MAMPLIVGGWIMVLVGTYGYVIVPTNYKTKIDCQVAAENLNKDREAIYKDTNASDIKFNMAYCLEAGDGK